DPDLPAALHVAGHRDTSRLDLARRDLARLDHLQSVVAERDRGAARRSAADAALHLLAVLDLLRLQHGLARLFPGDAVGQRALLQLAIGDVAFEDPALHADLSVRGVGFGQPVLDVGAQRVKRHAALAVPLAATHLCAAEPARCLDADAFGAELHGGGHGLLHRAAERDAALELHRDVLGDQLRVELRLADLLDVDEDVAGGERADFLAERVDLGAALADQDARPRGVDVHHDLLARAVDHAARDGGVVELLLDEAPDLHVLVELQRVAALREPVRLPPVEGAEPESVGMDLLSHAAP